MIPKEESFFKAWEKFNPAVTADEYCEAVERYMRMIWDVSEFPEKELKERRNTLIASYEAEMTIAKAADQFIDQIQKKNADPGVEAIIDELFRREAEQKDMLKKRQRERKK